MRFVLPSDIDLEAALAAATGVTARDATQQRLSRTFLDTFDWRLRRHRRTLVREHDGRSARLLLLDDDGTIESAEVNGEIPGWPEDLPSPLREEVDDVAGRRRLLVMGATDVHRVEARLVDADGRDAGWATVDELAFPKGPPVRILELRPGDRAKPTRRAGRELREHGLRPAPSDLVLATRAAGREVGVDPSRPRFELDADSPAGPVLVDMIGALTVAVIANEKGVRLRIDTEFLHDLRIAVRRARALLRHANGILDDGARQRWERELGWLQRVTGPARELDVLARWLATATATADLPLELADALPPLAERVAAERDHAHEQLLSELDGARFRRLRDHLAADIASMPLPFAAPDAGSPIASVAADRVAAAYRQARRRARRAERDPSPDRLHRARIRVKELRYVLESFETVLPVAERRRVRRRVRRLGAVLGRLHDEERLRAWLRVLATEDGAGPRLTPATVLAAGALVERSRVRSGELTVEAGAELARLTDARTRARIARLTASA